MKKIVLYSSMIGVGLFLGSAGVVNVSADSTASAMQSSLSTKINSDTQTNVSTEGTESNKYSSNVRYNVGTVEEAIEEASNSNEVITSNPSDTMLLLN